MHCMDAGEAHQGPASRPIRLAATIALLALGGCIHAGSACLTYQLGSENPDYGPNPLADCLRWPKDAPRQAPLYAP